METKNKNGKLAIGYVRVSTKDQKEHGISLEVQTKLCLHEIEQGPYEFLKIIYDKGLSAGTLNRRGVKEAINLIQEKKIAAIYTVHTDRIARNLEDHIYLRNLCIENGVEIIGINQPRFQNTATGRATDNVLATFAEMHKELTGEKVKDVLYAKASEGFFPAAAPVGYMNIDNPDEETKGIASRIIVPNPIMAPLVKELFILYSTGNYNVYELTDTLYEKGLKNRKGKKLHYGRVYEMLKNKIYIGEIKWGGGYCKKGRHELFIDESLFEKVQAVLHAHNGNRCKRRKYKWLLAGYLHCPIHKCKYTAEWHLKKKIAYYHCTNRSGCGKYIEQVGLENEIAEKFKDFEFSKGFVDEIIEKVRVRFEKARADYERKRQSLINQRTAYEAKRKVNENKLLSQVFTDEEFTRIKDEINHELGRINEQLVELEAERGENVDIVQEVLLFTKDIYKAYQKGSYLLKRHYLSFFWEKFEAQDGIIIKSIPSPLFRELSALNQVMYKTPQTEKSPITAGISQVITNDILGAYRDSNSN